MWGRELVACEMEPRRVEFLLFESDGFLEFDDPPRKKEKKKKWENFRGAGPAVIPYLRSIKGLKRLNLTIARRTTPAHPNV